jgi:hypothetical protein
LFNGKTYLTAESAEDAEKKQRNYVLLFSAISAISAVKNEFGKVFREGKIEP